jgi:hypothetical protein
MAENPNIDELRAPLLAALARPTWRSPP